MEQFIATFRLYRFDKNQSRFFVIWFKRKHSLGQIRRFHGPEGPPKGRFWGFWDTLSRSWAKGCSGPGNWHVYTCVHMCAQLCTSVFSKMKSFGFLIFNVIFRLFQGLRVPSSRPRQTSHFLKGRLQEFSQHDFFDEKFDENFHVWKFHLQLFFWASFACLRNLWNRWFSRFCSILSQLSPADSLKCVRELLLMMLQKVSTWFFATRCLQISHSGTHAKPHIEFCHLAKSEITKKSPRGPATTPARLGFLKKSDFDPKKRAF